MIFIIKICGWLASNSWYHPHLPGTYLTYVLATYSYLSIGMTELTYIITISPGWWCQDAFIKTNYWSWPQLNLISATTKSQSLVDFPTTFWTWFTPKSISLWEWMNESINHSKIVRQPANGLLLTPYIPGGTRRQAESGTSDIWQDRGLVSGFCQNLLVSISKHGLQACIREKPGRLRGMVF